MIDEKIVVFKPGDHVLLGDIEAVVLQVCIAPKLRVTYEVVWWSGRDRKTEWVSSFELAPSERTPEFLSIGFGASSTGGTS